MPTKGNPRHAFRFDADLWNAFLAAVGRDPHGRDASAVVRDLVAWYSGRRGAPRPERPPRREPGTPPVHDASPQPEQR